MGKTVTKCQGCLLEYTRNTGECPYCNHQNYSAFRRVLGMPFIPTGLIVILGLIAYTVIYFACE
jgi:hypothetical protein